MDSSPDRNPSPPLEILQNDEDFLPDRIGDSVYSKQWLFEILTKIVKTVSPSEKTDGDSTNGTVDANEIVEIDPQLEEDACVLWDMSANTDVAEFLHEHRAIEIFLGVIDKTQSPRLLEIVVGIMGNLASVNDICTDLSQKELIISSIITLSGTSDAPTVIQVLRLIHSCVVNKNTRSLWIEALKNSCFTENINFILTNSLNGDILKSSLQLLYYIFDEDEQVCLSWSDENCLKALVEAGGTLMKIDEHEGLDEYWLVLNVLCQYESNSTAFASKYDQIGPMFHSYFMKFGDHEDVLPHVNRVVAVAACFSTYAILLKSKKLDSEAMENEFILLGIVHKIFFSMHDILSKPLLQECDMNEQMDDSSPTQDGPISDKTKAQNQEERQNWFLLQESIIHSAEVLLSYVSEEDCKKNLLAEIIKSEVKCTPLETG